MTRIAIFLLFVSVALVNAKSASLENLMRKLLVEQEDSKRSVVRLTSAQKTQILDCHNADRRKEGASDMELMTWDDTLASMADGWADVCHWAHGQPSNPPITGDIGQNIYYTTAGSFDDVCSKVGSWYNEKVDYTYSTKGCTAGKMCGHYTQVVWAKSNRLGCGVRQCAPLTDPDKNNAVVASSAWLFVCNYLPPGNDGSHPFKKGDACSQCSGGSGWCTDGLCTTKAATPNAVCNLNCKNSGTLDSSACKCTCQAGWTSLDCSEQCVDTNSNCNNGWYPQNCAGYDFVRNGCPAMCGICQKATSGTPTNTGGSSNPAPAPAPAAPAPAPASSSGGSCASNEFKCANGECTYNGWVCDGEADCSDASDEQQNCPACASGKFQCGSGECIPGDWKCDQWDDCVDKSDEKNC